MTETMDPKASISRRRATRLLTGLALSSAAAATGVLVPARPSQAASTPYSPPSFTGLSRNFILNAPLEPAPEVAFVGAAEAPMALADFKGRVVLLNIWATWCAPCVREMPELDALQGKFERSDLEVLALSMDRAGEDTVRWFYKQNKLTRLKVYIDSQMRAIRTLGVRGLPTSFVIDRAGNLAGSLEGVASWDSSEAIEFIRYFVDAPLPSAQST